MKFSVILGRRLTTLGLLVKTLLFLSMFVVCACNTYANNDAYQRERHANLIDSNQYVRLFHIGGTLCDQRNNIWSEKCQDALLEDVYGPAWSEIKTVILAFQKAVTENDYRYLKGKTIIPKDTMHMVIFIKSDSDSPFFAHIMKHFYLTKEKQITISFFDRIPNELKGVIKNTKYENLIFDIWTDSIKFEWRAREWKSRASCTVHFKLVCDFDNLGPYKNPCTYFPRIESFGLSLADYQKIKQGISGGFDMCSK